MNKYTVRFRLEGQCAFNKIPFEAPDMEAAVKAGYRFAQGIHGIAVVDFQVVDREKSK